MKPIKKAQHFCKVTMLLLLFMAPSTSFATNDHELNELTVFNNSVKSETFTSRLMACLAKPKSLMVIGTVTMVVLVTGGICLYHNYDPEVMKEFLAHTWFNDSELGMMPNDGAYLSVPYPQCFDSCTTLPPNFVRQANVENDPYHGPGYITWIPSSYPEIYDPILNKGNLSDMVKTIMNLCGCDNFEQWYQYAKSTLDGAEFDPQIVHCLPNNDNQTMCCGSSWGNNTWPSWFPDYPDADLTMRMVNASGPCAQAEEHQTWTTNFWTYNFFAGLIPSIGFVKACRDKFMQPKDNQ